MKYLKYFDRKQLEQFLKPRYGETKIGQELDFITDLNELKNKSQEFVILGIPEDIGVKANHGNTGTRKAWNSFLIAFLNTQVNDYNPSENLIILGNIDCEDELKKAFEFDENHNDYRVFLGDLVENIDEKVSQVLKMIFNANKIPIIIGGGHNNAYGIIKGFSESFNRTLNVLNIDAHTDLRHMDYRHSGNGFSYALRNKYLKKYFIFGLHENYTPDYVFQDIGRNKNIDFCFFDHLLHLNPLERLSKLKHATNFLGESFGLEIDCDSMSNFDSSAVSPSGFTTDQMRNMIKLLKGNTLEYIHFCEAIPDEKGLIGKALSYFVSDLLRH
jgi:formiminoglutamase